MSDIIPEEYYAILRTNFLCFAMKFFELLNSGAKLESNWHHEAIAYRLRRILLGQSTRLIVNMQPRALKSFLVSVAWPAFILGKTPGQQIICISYTQDLAVKLARDFLQIVQSPFYKILFPHAAPCKATEAEYETWQGGFRYTTSVGGTLTGRGADIMILDDPLSATDAHSKSARERVYDWYTGTAVSRLNNPATGAVIVVAQRLHQDDLSGRLLLEQEGWEHFMLPAVAPDDRHIALSDTRMHHWKSGEVLHDRVPLSAFHRVKQQLGAETFNAQYMQEPVPETGNMIKRDYLQVVGAAPARQSSDKIVQSWDTAMKTSTSNDYSVCLTFQVVNNNQFYVIDIFRDRLEFPALANLVVTHAQKFNANAILVEDQVNGTSLIQEAKHRGLQGVIGRKPSTNKEARIQAQTTLLEAKSLFLPKHIAGLDDFITECLAFPGRHDDQVDALSQFLEWIAEQQRSISFSVDWLRDDQDPVPTTEEALYRFGRH